jgi:hypothetical protein
MTNLGDRVVLFGGFGDGGYIADTWTFDGATWTKLPITGPPARDLASFVTFP